VCVCSSVCMRVCVCVGACVCASPRARACVCVLEEHCSSEHCPENYIY